MALLRPPVDPTLEAVDRAIEQKATRDKPRPYLGMSAIGHPCDRRLWYGFRWAAQEAFDAATIKRFEDGHYQEDVQIDRLRMVPGITLLSVDPDTGRQWGFVDVDGHMKGHADGKIGGLLQAPKTWHIWEHKATDEKKQAKLEKLKEEKGEKNALAEWDETYYVQAQLYMHYSDLPRHYLTCSSPGGRKTVSCRTEYDADIAKRHIERARRIIYAEQPPERMREDRSYFMCKWCCFNDLCHRDDGVWADRNCRTCIFSGPVVDGWQCSKHDGVIPLEFQYSGCEDHLYMPPLVSGSQIDADDRGDWIDYQMADGVIWRDGECPTIH